MIIVYQPDKRGQWHYRNARTGRWVKVSLIRTWEPLPWEPWRNGYIAEVLHDRR